MINEFTFVNELHQRNDKIFIFIKQRTIFCLG